MSGRLLSKDKRGLKKRLIDFIKGSDNFSRMGKDGPTKKQMLQISGRDAGLKRRLDKRRQKKDLRK